MLHSRLPTTTAQEAMTTARHGGRARAVLGRKADAAIKHLLYRDAVASSGEFG